MLCRRGPLQWRGNSIMGESVRSCVQQGTYTALFSDCFISCVCIHCRAILDVKKFQQENLTSVCAVMCVCLRHKFWVALSDIWFIKVKIKKLILVVVYFKLFILWRGHTHLSYLNLSLWGMISKENTDSKMSEAWTENIALTNNNKQQFIDSN